MNYVLQNWYNLTIKCIYSKSLSAPFFLNCPRCHEQKSKQLCDPLLVCDPRVEKPCHWILLNARTSAALLQPLSQVAASLKKKTNTEYKLKQLNLKKSWRAPRVPSLWRVRPSFCSWERADKFITLLKYIKRAPRYLCCGLSVNLWGDWGLNIAPPCLLPADERWLGGADPPRSLFHWGSLTGPPTPPSTALGIDKEKNLWLRSLTGLWLCSSGQPAHCLNLPAVFIEKGRRLNIANVGGWVTGSRPPFSRADSCDYLPSLFSHCTTRALHSHAEPCCQTTCQISCAMDFTLFHLVLYDQFYWRTEKDKLAEYNASDKDLAKHKPSGTN